VYAGADAASQRRLNMAFRACLRYIHSLRRLDHASHLETSVMGASLADYARIQLLLFLCKVLHVNFQTPMHDSTMLEILCEILIFFFIFFLRITLALRNRTKLVQGS
jgi:hypothetical protein